MKCTPETFDQDERVCAYIATSYVLGVSLAQLIKGLSGTGPRARELLAGLAHPERRERARMLASGLRPIIKALDSRRLA